MKLASEACGCAQTSLYLLVNAGIKQSSCFMVRLTVLCTYKLKFFFFLTIFFPSFFSCQLVFGFSLCWMWQAGRRCREQESSWGVRIFLKEDGRGCESVSDGTDLHFLLYLSSWLSGDDANTQARAHTLSWRWSAAPMGLGSISSIKAAVMWKNWPSDSDFNTWGQDRACVHIY